MKKHNKNTRENVWENTYKSLSLLVDNVILMQDMHKGMHSSGRPPSHIENCTVEFSGHRGMGHSYALCKVAYEYFNDVIFLTHSRDWTKGLRRTFQEANDFKEEPSADWVDQVSFKNLSKSPHYPIDNYYFKSWQNLSTTCGINTEAIIVDNAHTLSESKKEEIYKTLYPAMSLAKNPIFIFVQ